MIHLTPQQLSSYMDGELNEASTELVRRHMGACEECTLKFASLEIQEDLLSRALVHDPGEEFFEQFTADVARQIPGAKYTSSQRARATPAPKPAVSKSPAPAEKSVVAPPQASPSRALDLEPEPVQADDSPDFYEIDTVVSASDGRLVTDESTTEVEGPYPPREAPLPLRRADPPRQAEAPRRVEPPAPRPKAPPRPKPAPYRPHRPAPSVPWYAALILAAVSASVGVVVSRTEPVSSWIDGVIPSLSPRLPGQNTAPEALPAAPETEPATLGATRGIESALPIDDEAMDPDITPAGGAAPEGPDFMEPVPQKATRFVTQPRAGEAVNRKDLFASVPVAALAQIRAAQRSIAAADADPSAARYETAAADWERAVPLLQGWQQVQGRFEVASARYRAWEMAPTAARATAAISAIRSYMTFAAQGPARDQARAWMARLAR